MVYDGLCVLCLFFFFLQAADGMRVVIGGLPFPSPLVRSQPTEGRQPAEDSIRDTPVVLSKDVTGGENGEKVESVGLGVSRNIKKKKQKKKEINNKNNNKQKTITN